MRNQGLRLWFLVLPLLVLAACSGSSDSDVGLIGAESLYDPGASVGAVGYSEAYGIELYLLNEDGSRVMLSDGDYVEPGTRTLGVRIDGNPANVDRVLLSDGGVYQVRAGRDEDFYIAEFKISQEHLYQNVLVQVIHISGLASKEKIVLRSFEHEYDDRFIKNSIGLLVGNDVLSDLRESLAEMLDEMFQKAISNIAGQGSGVINEISYGDSDPSTTDVVITSLRAENNESYPRSELHISLIIKDVYLSACSLYGQSLITTSDNDLAVSCYLAIEDEGEDGSIRVILDLSDSAQVQFEQEFFLKDVVEELLLTQLTKIELPCLVSDLAGLGDGLSYDLAEYILFYGKELDSETFFDVEDSGMLDKFLFVDAYGIPEGTNEEALGLGL
ncbi:MAG: hypothetical protein JXM72_05890, partial [Deltaproteobacteria bacterium]|nr:hypothetical protein [Deltaproteobacteria bacterium]